MNAGKPESKEAGQTRPSFFARLLTASQISTGRARGAAIFLALVTVTLVGGLWQSAPAEDEPAIQPAVLAVNAFTARQLPEYEQVQSFVGRVEAARESRLGFERGGQLIELLIDEGDRVEAGQVLARLDTRALEARRAELLALRGEAVARLEEMQAGPRPEVIAAARADVARWNADAELALINRQRQEQLHEKGAITDQQWDESRFNEEAVSAGHRQAIARLDELLAGTRSEQIAAQQAVVDHLLAQLESLTVELDKSQLFAPFAGRVAGRLVDEGVVVAPGEPLVELLETDKLRARIGVAGDAAGELSLGGTYLLRHEQEQVAARVLAIRPDRNQQTRTIAVLFELESSDTARLHTGDLITLDLSQQVSARGFWVPISALSESVRGLWCCYTLQPLSPESDQKVPSQATHRIGRCELELLHTATDRAFVRGTLRDGDLVVTQGVHRLVPGQAVQIATSELADSAARQPRGER